MVSMVVLGVGAGRRCHRKRKNLVVARLDTKAVAETGPSMRSPVDRMGAAMGRRGRAGGRRLFLLDGVESSSSAGSQRDTCSGCRSRSSLIPLEICKSRNIH